MNLPENYGNLLTLLSILSSIIMFWADKKRTLQYRFINALLVGIVIVAIGISIAVFGANEEYPYKPTDPTETAQVTDLHVGDTITFGTYEQDGNSSTRKEPIEWEVLDIVDNKILVLSTKAIDCKPYNDQDTGCTWATCSLRKWLNGTFRKTAFSSEEQAQIMSVDVAAHENPDFSTNPGMSTEDHIFLLSVDEANQYLPYSGDRMCSPTEFAKEQGGFEKKSLGTCWWWLRTPGETSSDACSVNSDGTIDTDDGTVNSDKGCVRPAMWLSIEAVE